MTDLLTSAITSTSSSSAIAFRMRWRFSRELPPDLAVALLVILPSRSGLTARRTRAIGQLVLLAPRLRSVVEVDDPPRCRAIRTRVEVFSVEVTETAPQRSRVVLDPRFRLVWFEHEAHAEHDSSPGRRFRRSQPAGPDPVDSPARFQERRDPRDDGRRRHIRGTSRPTSALGAPDRRIFQVRAGRRPRSALDRAGDRESVRDHLVEPDFAGVALRDGVRRDEAERSPTGQQRHAPAGRSRRPGRRCPSCRSRER